MQKIQFPAANTSGTAQKRRKKYQFRNSSGSRDARECNALVPALSMAGTLKLPAPVTDFNWTGKKEFWIPHNVFCQR
jgi:hypothetical protein